MKHRKLRKKQPPCETGYWRKANKGIALSDYPDVDVSDVTFPTEIYVAYAVCRNCCGRREFIVDGSTQICHYCGKPMFRIGSKKYVLSNDQSGG